MTLTALEKRVLFSTTGSTRHDVEDELRNRLRCEFSEPELKAATETLLIKLSSEISNEALPSLLQSVDDNYQLPADAVPTIAELAAMERRDRGSKRLLGHDICDLKRYADTTKHMVEFEVISANSSVGFKGDKMRLFLTEAGYARALEKQAEGHIHIINHARVLHGNLIYDHHIH